MTVIEEKLHFRDDVAVPDSRIPVRSEPVGAQLPTLFVAPALNDQSLADTGLDFLDAIGFSYLPWQEIEIQYALDIHADSQWSCREIASIVPRQNGKNHAITALELIHLFLIPETRQIVHTAHQFKTAKAAFRDLKTAILAEPELAAEVRSIRDSAQDTCIILQDGSRIDFIARSSGSGRGFTVDLLVLDEAYALDQQTLSDLLPTTDAAFNPQIIYASSTGFEDSDVLASLHDRIERLINEPDSADPADCRLLGMEWMIDPDTAQWDSPEACAAANPSLGYFLHWSRIKSMSLEAVSKETYLRERLGVWPRTRFDTVIPAEVWEQTYYAEGLLAGDPVIAESIGFEVSRDRHAYIAVAALTRSGRVLVDIFRDAPGTGWCIEAMQEIYDQVEPVSGVVMDNAGAAGSMETSFSRMGLNTSFVNTAGLGRATAEFFDRLTMEPEPMLFHAKHPALDDAAYTVGRRFLGGEKTAWTWSKNSGVADEPLRACTLALWGLAIDKNACLGE